jgi:hypothetical protein
MKIIRTKKDKTVYMNKTAFEIKKKEAKQDNLLGHVLDLKRGENAKIRSRF